MPPVPKPIKSTPEDRRRERQQREHNPLKPVFTSERIRDQEQTPIVKADPSDSNLYKLSNNTLHTIGKKRLAKLSEGHKRLTSTFTCRDDRKFLQRTRRAHGGQKIRSVVRSSGHGKLHPIGVRGRRLLQADRKASAECGKLSCICGCQLAPQWAHLIRRSIESTRHDPVYSVPACEYLHPWLDQGPGVQIRVALRKKAEELGRRLTHEDAFALLQDGGYYTDLAERRAKER